MIFLRELWKYKPPAWGPASHVKSIVQEKCDNIYKLPKPLIYFGMLEGAGATAHNLSGDTNATIQGFGWKNKALYAGSNVTQRIDLPADFLPLDGTTSFSVMLDFYLDATVSADRGLFYTKSHAGSNPILLWADSASQKKFAAILSTNISSTGTALSGQEISAGNRYIVFLTWDGSALRLYINGKEDTAGDFPKTLGGTLRVGTQYIFGNSSDYLKPFFGYFNQCGLWAEAIPQSQIAFFNDYPYGLVQPPVFCTYFIPTDISLFLINNIEQTQNADLTPLAQLHSLLFDTVSQTQTVDIPSLTQLHLLIYDSVAQGQLTTALSLTQLHNLLTNSINQGQIVDDVTIKLLTSLLINNISQTQSTEAVTLTQLINIIIGSISQSQDIDSNTIQQIHDILITSILQSQSVDAVELSIPGVLAIYSILQGQSVQAQTLAQKISLALADIHQSQNTDNSVLEQLHTLTTEGVTQTQDIDTQSLEQLITLSIENLSHSQYVSELSFFQVLQIDINDVTQTQDLGTLNLSQVSELIVQNVLHGNTIEALNFSAITGIVTITIETSTPGVTFG